VELWNDFKYEDLSPDFKGIKWHRHPFEPEYDYANERCERFLQEVYARSLPIVFEETYENTLYFIKRVAGRTLIIIPHLGRLNGGFSRLVASGVWEEEKVYADTALASVQEICEFVERYGSRKLLYGVDYRLKLTRFIAEN
jgi:predicted TIM-barrel fold metal-dependent hydrolase